MALIVALGVLFFGSSDCEKAYLAAMADPSLEDKMKEKLQSEDGRKVFMDMCGALDSERKKCLGGAANIADIRNCMREERERNNTPSQATTTTTPAP